MPKWRLYKKAYGRRHQLENRLLKDCKFLGAVPAVLASSVAHCAPHTVRVDVENNRVFRIFFTL